MRRLVILLAALVLCHSAMAQYGVPLYGYATIPLNDNTGQPLIDGKTGQQIKDGFCIAWPSTGISGRFHVNSSARGWITAADDIVDVQRRTVMIT
jgi:hypothetical protein